MDASALTAFDIGVLVIVGLSTVLAFGKGFANVALSLAAWAGAFAAVIFGNAFVEPYMREWVSPPELASILSVVSVFFVALFALKLIGGLIGDSIKNSPVGFLDRSLGALFGLVRGMVIVSLLYFGFTAIFKDQEVDWIENAKTKPLVAWGAEMLKGYAAEALGEDPTSVGEDYLQKAASSVQSQFIEEQIAEQAAKYLDKDRAELEQLVMDQLEKNPELKKQLEDRLKEEIQKRGGS